MSNGEEYILEVLRVVQKNLIQKLKPELIEKINYIFDRLKNSELLRGEIVLLQRVENFQAPALAMEWILFRETNSKSKNYSTIFSNDVKIIESEFQKSLNEIKIEKKETEKSLTEIIDKNLLIGFNRFTEIINSLPTKAPNERRAVIVLLMMVAKSSIEMAKVKKNLVMQNLFESIISFVDFVESKGEVESLKVANLLSDIGKKLSNGINSTESGTKILTEVNLLLSNPQKVLG